MYNVEFLTKLNRKASCLFIAVYVKNIIKAYETETKETKYN